MPDYFIYFDINPSTIDVNIHPTKTEIKFENERPIWQIVFSAVREALARSNSVPSIDFEAAGIIDIPIYNPSQDDNMNTRPPEIEVNKNYNPFRETSLHRPTDDWKALYDKFENDRTEALLPDSDLPDMERQQEEEALFTDFDPENTMSSASSTGIDNEIFTNVSNPCFQYKNRYIITPLKSGLVIIDQHRAHTRILYEKYISNINHRHAVSQKLLFPEMAEFTMAESSLLPSLADEIKFLGFDLVHMGGNSYAIHGVPADVSGGNPVALVKDVVTAALESGVSEMEKKSEHMALSLAKAMAIPSGKVMAPEEMETLVASLFALETNGMTPDGLPVLTILSDEEMAKRF
jgi:DNA mismatch repair protein MutL